ncbi:MAG TPA: hypothetical protein VK886_23550 [Vicinamibacterales bacterium]|nr:hypothetical protein [Vicinamibacterales bacterium]
MAVRWIRSSATLVTLLAALAGAGPASAGPPLLCEPFDTNGSPSLPWDSRHGWMGPRSDYDIRNLVADTQALLTPETPVIARMETLRRAALYASADEAVAARLLATLTERAGEGGKLTKTNALARFDAAYFVETLRQIGTLGQDYRFGLRSDVVRRVIGDADGYAQMREILSVRTDPALEYAAALMVARRDPSAARVHTAKARAGSRHDALLARNLKPIS